MIKKFFIAIILAMTLCFTTSYNNLAQASDYYVGTYPSGLHAFLMTETINFVVSFRVVNVRVKVVDSQQKIINYIDYTTYDIMEEGLSFENSQGYSGKIKENTVERNIYDYIFHEWSRKISRGN